MRMFVRMFFKVALFTLCLTCCGASFMLMDKTSNSNNYKKKPKYTEYYYYDAYEVPDEEDKVEEYDHQPVDNDDMSHFQNNSDALREDQPYDITHDGQVVYY